MASLNFEFIVLIMQRKVKYITLIPLLAYLCLILVIGCSKNSNQNLESKNTDLRTNKRSISRKIQTFSLKVWVLGNLLLWSSFFALCHPCLIHCLNKFDKLNTNSKLKLHTLEDDNNSVVSISTVEMKRTEKTWKLRTRKNKLFNSYKYFCHFKL